VHIHAPDIDICAACVCASSSCTSFIRNSPMFHHQLRSRTIQLRPRQRHLKSPQDGMVLHIIEGRQEVQHPPAEISTSLMSGAQITRASSSHPQRSNVQ
jgi:hypothetical protein